MQYSYIVDFWSNIFKFLSKISIFTIIRLIFPFSKSYAFVESWVLFNLAFSLSSIFISIYTHNTYIKYSLLAYGALRTFEIVIYQVNVLIFDEYRAKKSYNYYALRGYRRIVLLLLHNYVEIIFWFASNYIILSENFLCSVPNGSASAFTGIYSSFMVMTSFGDPKICTSSSVGLLIMLSQAFVGLFMTLLSLARFISLIPTPKTIDEFEK